MSSSGSDERSAGRNDLLIRWTRPLAIAGGFLLIVVAGAVVISVVMRWLTQSSIPGDFELVQMATALAAFAFFPLCQAERGNIMVDTFTQRLPKHVLNKIDALWDVVYAIIAAIVAWRLAIGAYDTIRTNMVTMVLALPQGWAVAACAAMAVLLVAVTLATAWRLLRGER